MAVPESNDNRPAGDAAAPVETIATDSGRGPDEGTALCLSGGGYRAMVFHVGAVWRLYEAGMLKDIKRISSVSGGSITAGVLALAWDKFSFDQAALQTEFVEHFVKPLRKMASKTIDRWSILGGMLLPGEIGDKVTASYKKHLFGDKTLQDLPDHPRFVFNATNVQSGALWRFMKPYMRDWRVGEVRNPTVSIARAVAASSAFPPVLSPVTLELSESDFTPDSGADLQRKPFTTDVVLSDGGVYDNLGLETAFKRYRTILVSDAGGQMPPEEDPKHDWAQHSYRVLNIIDNQVRARRKIQLIEAYQRGDRDGVYWGIRTNVADYDCSVHLPCPHASTMALANVATRLKRMDDKLQDRLINWGYAVSDAALRAHVVPDLPEGRFPYPESGI